MNDKYLVPNSILGNRYLIVKLLAEGGMGTVYEAKDNRLGGTVALKKTLFTEDHLQKQFEREARLLANLRHMGLPKVIDQFTDENGQFLVMEFIAGQDLKSLLEERKQPFPYEEVLLWGDQLLDILQYLHSRQPPIFHRDIKPQNLKLNDEGIVILLDFGLAKGTVPDMTHLGPSNTLLGCTLEYAPLEQLVRINHFMPLVTSSLDAVQIEQIIGESTDGRADLYSLAVTMYHLITGNISTNAMERFLVTGRGQPDPLPLANKVLPDVPPSVATFLMQAMAIRREKRFSSAIAMRRALQEIISTTTPVFHATEPHLPSSDEIANKPRINFKNVGKTPKTLKLKPGVASNNDADEEAKTIRFNAAKVNPALRPDKNKRADLSPRIDFKGAKESQQLKAPLPKTLKLKPVPASRKGLDREAETTKAKALRNDSPLSNKIKGK